jgi:MFS transporter, FHS family, L-fucose permease
MNGRTLSTPAAIAVLSIIFFTWGALTCLNDVLIPHLKAVFAMNYAQTMLIQFTFFGTYFIMSIPAGRVVAHAGYKQGIIIGLLVAAGGALLFYPAAGVPSYLLFLVALFVLASGITLLQVAANPYISLLGDPRRASARLTLAQALNSLGTTLAPWLIGPVILAVAVLGPDALGQLPPAQQEAYRIAQAHSVQSPYLAIAVALLLLAGFVWMFHLPAQSEVLRYRHVRLGALAIFVYVGGEVAIGSFLISYISDPRIGDIAPAAATRYVALYWGGAMVGRFVGSLLLRLIDPRRLLCLFALAVLALLATTISSSGHLAMWSIIAIGLFNSIMFPTIFTLGIEGLGPMTSRGSSLLVMAIVGGALIPYLQGVLADHFGVQRAFLLPVLCYAYIAWYSLHGSRPVAPLAQAVTATS